MNIPHHLRIFFFKSHVRAYTTKHGVFVAAHEDKRQKKAVPGHKRVENQDGTDLFSAPAAPVADKVKKPTTRDLGKSRLDAFIKKHHGLPNLAHHIGQMTDAERQRIYTEMGKLGNKTPTEVSLMFRGVKPVSAVQEDLFGKEKVKEKAAIPSKSPQENAEKAALEAFNAEKDKGLKVLRAEEAAYDVLLEDCNEKVNAIAARANGESIADVVKRGEEYSLREGSFALEDYTEALFKDKNKAGSALRLLGNVFAEAEKIAESIRTRSLVKPPASATPPSNSGSGGKPPGKPPVATGGEEDKDDFLKSPDGSIDFGEITAEQAKAIKRQAGKIRLQQGDDSYGARHIELRHGKDIRGVGFKDAAAFISDALKHIDAIWKPAKTSQMVVIEATEHGKAVFVELKPSDSGDFYTVNSAFPTPRTYADKKAAKEGWVKLWGSMALQPSAPAAQNPSAEQLPEKAGGNVATPSGQSLDSSVGDKTGKIKAPSVAKNQPAAWEEDDEESQPVIPTESKAALFLMKTRLGAGWKKSEFPGDTVRKVIAKLIKLGLLDNSNKILTVTRAGRNYIDKYHLVIGKPLTKSLPPRYLFLKSLSRPAPSKAAPAKPRPAQAKAPAAYGHHNVDEGDALHFAAGSFKGKGKVKSVGESGAVLEDDAGRDHNVHWHEITGRHQANHKPEPARSAAP